MKRMCIFVLLFAICCFTHATAQVVPAVRQAAAVSRELPRLDAAAVRAFGMAPVRLLPGTRLETIRYIPPYQEPSSQPKEWLTEHQRFVINVQRLAGISKIQAIRNVRGWGAEYQAKDPRPALLADQAFQTTDLKGMTVPEKAGQTLPEHPFQNQRRLIYRGLALDVDGKAVRNILKNGLLLKDVGPFSNTLLYTLSGPNSRSRSVRTPVINLTDNAKGAAGWAKTRKAPSQIGVVVAVESTQTGKIITYNKDIPAESIYALTALLMVDGQPMWCKVEWNDQGFLITPYKPVQP